MRNGSFEAPVISIGQSDKNNPVYGGGDVIWKTTATDNLIEIVAPEKSASSVFQWHGVTTASEGKQCAEINAEQSSALYQDVLTVPGSTMYWQLSHLGRTMNSSPVKNTDGTSYSDTMYVLIMPYDQAKDITTQAQVNEVISNKDQYPDAQVTTIIYTWRWTTVEESSGRRSTTYYVMQHKVGEEWIDTYKYKAGDPSSVEQLAPPWEAHSGKYEVPTGQYLTRYFFVAGNTASGDVDATTGCTTRLIDSEKETATITNNKGADPDTGITLDSMPYVVMLVVVCAGLFVVLAKKRAAREN